MNENIELARANGPVAGQVVRYGFEGEQIENRAETAATAVAAREAAAIQARYIVANKNRRNIDDFRQALMHECKRPGFAAKAEYAKPVGKEKNPDTGKWEEKKVKGPSIRFIETALRCFRNVYPEVAMVFDSPTLRICRASVTDLESNVTYTSEIAIAKQVERKGTGSKGDEPPKGRDVISSRLNTYGDPVFLVVATDDEVLVKQNALQSKAIRTLGQRLLPFDVVEEAMDLARKTAKAADAQDPDAARRRMLDAFGDLGVSPSSISEYLGHSSDKLNPAELEDLREIYTALKEGESTWNEVMTERDPVGSKEAASKVAEEKLANLRKPKEASTITDPVKSDKPVHIQSIEQYRAEIGDAYMRILGAAGYESADFIPEDKWQAVAAEMDAVLRDKRDATKTEEKPQKRLKL